MAPRTVLIVEDDATLAHAVARNLAARGYQTQMVGTVEGAREAVQAQLPALVLLDIDLPDGSGWEIARAMRANGHGGVPVVVLSALRPNPRLVAELGCVGVLEKPFPMDSLLRMVAQYIGRPEPASAVE